MKVIQTKTIKIFLGSIIIAYDILSSTYSFSQPPGEWTWMHGDSTPNSSGVFGVQSASSPVNTPPAVYEPCEWTDKNGNLWLFGGLDNTTKEYAALWKYDPATNQWTWMKGPSIVDQPGIYGTQGVSSPANYPGSRSYGTIAWEDTSGNLWLFGGYGYDAAGVLGNLNDLWKYDISVNEWTWMKGPNAANNTGLYGTKGIPTSANLPPSRTETSCSWTDNAGNLWLYGGGGVNSNLSDLWKYDISTNEWTWMHGANILNMPAVYGTQGVASPANTPGGRQVYCSWTDLSGNLWLFGGWRIILPSVTYFNDLWKYNIAVNQWTWVKGSNTSNDPGNYGNKCVSTNSNTPQATCENRARVRDACGNFWSFGGSGGLPGSLNVLWHYNVSTNQWTWVSGNNITNQAAVYGTLGISNAANKPAAKAGSVAWIDNNGHIWVFGGISGGTDYYNDLFRYVPDTACPYASVVITVSSNTTICSGQSATLTASGSTNYSWFPGGQSNANIVVSPTTSTTYTVTGDNACGSGSASVTVSISQLPPITAFASNPIICSGQSATLISSGGMNYLWSSGGQSTSTVVVSPTTSITYTVIGSNADNCTAAATAAVTVNTTPTATAWNNITITAGSNITLNSSSNPPAATYNWSPATGLSCITCQNPIASPIFTTMYCVTVTDANNCTDTACVTVTIEPIDCSNAGELYIPNAFSPNGDSENDVLKLYYGTPQCIKTFKLTIYNRWGEKVFQTKNPVAGWDGYYRDKIENTAVFVYYLNATLISGEEIIRKGNVSLIR